LVRVGSKRRTMMPLPGISSAVSDLSPRGSNFGVIS